MQFEQLKEYAPFLAVIAGVLLFAWSQKTKILPYLRIVLPSFTQKPKHDCRMTPPDRFATFYALRTWCFTAGYQEAVMALDEKVLPFIVQSDTPPEDWPKTLDHLKGIE